MRCHLQVNVGGKAYIYDLTKPGLPCVRQLIAMDKLLDCDKYVENGFQIQYKDSQIRVNETTGVYF